MLRNIAVGISGGVDSAVAAYLLKEKGFNVLGVFMRNWDGLDEVGHCTGEDDLRDAEYTCQKLKIELRQVNYVKAYWNLVFVNFLENYESGFTPNPDILCNKYIKFDIFYKYVMEQIKYDAVATGHYAKSSFGNFLENYKENEGPRLLLPRDRLKDQTFFLSGVKREAFKRSVFPLADLYKSEVKEIARKCGLQRLAKKKESTGICFVGHRKFQDFIKEYIRSRPGNFIDIDNGQIVGTHNGIHQWTLGQRCRLHSYLQPYYVARKDVKSNNIYVAYGHENPALYSDYIEATDINWICPDALKSDVHLRCWFRFQHAKPLVKCSVIRHADDDEANVTIVLDEEVRAITPGQYAVFYSERECLGSARILKSKKKPSSFKEEPYNRPRFVDKVG